MLTVSRLRLAGGTILPSPHFSRHNKPDGQETQRQNFPPSSRQSSPIPKRKADEG